MKQESKTIRLNKAIAMTGSASRRKADDLICAGKVKVNGKVITELGYKVLASDKIQINNKQISVKENSYLLFYKPCGYITTTKDEHERKTIYDLLPVKYKHLNPIGRLDKESDGLLLLSNDGDFINQVLHPKNNIKKTYIIKINAILNSKETDFIRNELLSGVNLEGRIFKVDSIRKITGTDVKEGKQTIFEAVIHEGINRQIRRMFQQLGYSVDGLKRTKIGNLNLGNLKKGHCQELTKESAYAILCN